MCRIIALLIHTSADTVSLLRFDLRYVGCSFSDVSRSVTLEVVALFIYNILIPSKNSPSLRTHSSTRRMETTHGTLNLLPLRGSEVNAEKFPPSQLYFGEGEQPRVTWSQVGTVGEMGQNLDVFCSSRKVTVTWICGLLLCFGILFSFFFFFRHS